MKDLFFFNLVVLKSGLLQNIDENIEGLVHFSAQAFNDVSEEIGLVHDLNTPAGILEQPRDIFRIESLRAADRTAQHEFGDACVLVGFVQTAARIEDSERHKRQPMVFDDV